jgi:hypothetical protein
MNYCIEGAKHNGHIDNNSLPIYSTFQEDLENFKQMIISFERNQKGASFVHFGDGDYYFLKKIAIGSATPGKRALSIPYDMFDITPYREGWKKADYHCVEYLEHGNPEKLRELYPDQSTIATEFLYGLLMNKWFLKTFNGKIGLFILKNYAMSATEVLSEYNLGKNLGGGIAAIDNSNGTFDLKEIYQLSYISGPNGLP